MPWCLGLLLSFMMLLPACGPASALPPLETPAGGGDWYAVYFSDPNGPGAETLRGGPDAALVEAITDARVSVDVAIYDLNLWSLRDALLDAQRRGVKVRIVVESDSLDRPEIQALKEAGIPMLGDRRSALMHNKFVVIDRFEVWTGSMNFTVNGAYHNDNNLLRLRSSRLAENYLAEFEEMFSEGEFGPASPSNSPQPTLSIEGTRVEIYFSPEDGALQRMVQLIEAAEQSVYFMAFSFTSDDIAHAMLFAADGGVEVAGVFEATQYSSNIGSEFDRLVDAGQNVQLDGNPDRMHHKVIIIDESIVITGSYNFSAAAENSNDENSLVIHDASIAALYLEEFERVFFEALQ